MNNLFRFHSQVLIANLYKFSKTNTVFFYFESVFVLTNSSTSSRVFASLKIPINSSDAFPSTFLITTLILLSSFLNKKKTYHHLE